MAVDYIYAAAIPNTVIECKNLIKNEIRLRVSPQHPDLWLVNAGTTVVVQHIDDVPYGMDVLDEMFGFTPTIVISIRPELGAAHNEEGMRTMMQTVDLMLRSFSGDAGFSLEYERVLLLRRNGKVYVRKNYIDHINHEDVAVISLPYELRPLRP